MARREEWHKILDAEVQRWSSMSWRELESALSEGQVYEVEVDSKRYQVEVELLKNTEEYLHIYVGVDDGTLPASMFPVSSTFICPKSPPSR